MKDNFWNLFRETGEPMCFLLSKAEMGLYDMPGEKRFSVDAAAKAVARQKQKPLGAVERSEAEKDIKAEM